MNNDRLVRIEAEQLLILREDPNISSKALRRALSLPSLTPAAVNGRVFSLAFFTRWAQLFWSAGFSFSPNSSGPT